MLVWAMFVLRFMPTLYCLSRQKHLSGICTAGPLARAEICVGALYTPWPICHRFRYWRRRLALGSSGVLRSVRALQLTSYRSWLQPLTMTFWVHRRSPGGTGWMQSLPPLRTPSPSTSSLDGYWVLIFGLLRDYLRLGWLICFVVCCGMDLLETLFLLHPVPLIPFLSWCIGITL